MIITYQGGQSFKISQGDLAVAINPQAKTSADVTLFSTLPAETSEKSGFVITGPGEYEVKDIFIKGFLAEGKERLSTVYLVSFEGMKLCFMCDLATPELPAAASGQLDDIDILFVPTDAYKLAVSLEPSLIIPVAYTKATLDQFVKESGAKDVAPLDKLVVKKKDLEGKEGEIVVLKEE
jgi:L-ascorbate metabolism protein UlaG (beta-lactamase superfamily)